MRSFVIWYESNNPEEKKLDLHVNLWKTNKGDYLFDFGFYIYNIEDIEELCLYTPFDIYLKNVSDLGDIISKNNLASSIFNERLKTTTGFDKKVLVEKLDFNSSDNFFIYALDVDNQISLKEMKRSDGHQGKILKIKIPEIDFEESNEKKYYFRFRLRVPFSELELVSNEIKGESLLSSSLTNTEIIDFRINDIRSCNNNLREKFNLSKKFNINKIHYLILRNVSDTILHHDSSVKTRMLEEDIWKDYIEETEYKNDKIIAYHMKKTFKEDNKGISDYINLTRFRYSKNPFKAVLISILLVIVINIISNFIYGKIFDADKSVKNKVTKTIQKEGINEY